MSLLLLEGKRAVAFIPRDMLPIIRHDLRQAIALLPTTDEGAVAWFLREHGARGERGAAQGCPVAAYLQRTVGTVSVQITSPWHLAPAECGEPFELPDSVLRFICAFDGGDFIDLQEPSS